MTVPPDFSGTILDNLNDAVVIINAGDFSIAKANSAFCAMHGVSPEALEGQTCHYLIHGSASPCLECGDICPVRETLTTGRHASSGHLHFTSTGEMRYVENSTSPVFDSGELIVQVVLVTRDITGKTLMELALRESEERFRQIFAQDDDALFVLDPYTHAILDANPTAVQTYGYAADEMSGKPVSLLFDAAGYEQFTAQLKETAMDKTIMIPRATHVRKDGSSLQASLRVRLIRLKDRAVLYCSFRDMTDKFRLQEEALDLQAKLIHANKMTSLGTLVSGVAHEINNPNNFILFNAQLLAEAWRDVAPILEARRRTGEDFTLGGLPFEEMRDVVPRLLAGISDGSQRITAIVKNLKDFARQERPGLDAPVDINEVVKTSAAIMDSHIKKHTAAFSIELGRDLPAVRGSSQQLEQVVINLIMNALLALPGYTRGVKVVTSGEPLGTVVIRVRDEGVGMTADVMERVTEPFFTTRLDQGGTGLGLSISYSIVKAHCGSIVFESEPGRGTTVTVSLPAYKAGHDHE